MATTCIAVQSQEPQSALERLLATAAISVAVLLGLSAAAEASLVVSLQQVGLPPVPVSGQQTLVTGRLVVSGTLEQPLSTAAFGTLLTWTSSNSLVSNLYTVNGSGVPVTNFSALIADTPGFLYAASAPQTFMSGTSEAPARSMSVSGEEPFPSLTGTFSNIPIMDISFAVAANVSNATFNFVLAGEPPTYGFTDSEFNAVGFSNGGGSIVVVPEPGTVPAGIVGLVVIGGWMTRRSRRQQDVLAGSVARLTAI